VIEDGFCISDSFYLTDERKVHDTYPLPAAGNHLYSEPRLNASESYLGIN